MPNRQDRIIHALTYEAFALVTITLIITPLFDIQADKSLTIGIVFSVFAVFWNVVFNHAFDWALTQLNGSDNKSLLTRIVHALAFEGTLLIPTLPVLAWWLDTNLYGALKIELFLIIYITIYTFFFNLVYDHVASHGGYKPAATRSSASGESEPNTKI